MATLVYLILISTSFVSSVLSTSAITDHTEMIPEQGLNLDSAMQWSG